MLLWPQLKLSNFKLQGISTVLETGIGAPDPEELARLRAKETKESKSEEEVRTPVGPGAEKKADTPSEELKGSGGDAFQFGSLFSGVTKFVETTGKNVKQKNLHPILNKIIK